MSGNACVKTLYLVNAFVKLFLVKVYFQNSEKQFTPVINVKYFYHVLLGVFLKLNWYFKNMVNTDNFKIYLPSGWQPQP